MIVRAPGSSANLGPGFDALGLALTRYAEVGLAGDEVPPGARWAPDTHPAAVAFRSAGGTGALWVRSQLPMGRGMGYSGAVRVAGAMAGLLQAHETTVIDTSLRATALALTAQLEGHADNAAASVHGGVVATAGGRAVRIPLALEPAVVVWIPTFTTSTDASRRRLGPTVTFEDATFNVGRVALLVAALAAGDVEALGVATEDRLHQELRLAAAEPTRQAISDGLAAGAWAAWLSGSGPTAAFLTDTSTAAGLAAALPPDGQVMVLGIAAEGVTVEDVTVEEVTVGA
jgi:homoserine kinase